jgi:hypothetical protein
LQLPLQKEILQPPDFRLDLGLSGQMSGNVGQKHGFGSNCGQCGGKTVGSCLVDM